MWKINWKSINVFRSRPADCNMPFIYAMYLNSKNQTRKITPKHPPATSSPASSLSSTCTARHHHTLSLL